MWRPFSKLNVPLRLGAPGVLVIDRQRATTDRYEQMLTFPILTSLLQHPTVIVGINDTFWVDDTDHCPHQVSALRSWAKLFQPPCLLAVKS
jgi:hypothetical protein